MGDRVPGPICARSRVVVPRFAALLNTRRAEEDFVHATNRRLNRCSPSAYPTLPLQSQKTASAGARSRSIEHAVRQFEPRLSRSRSGWRSPIPLSRYCGSKSTPCCAGRTACEAVSFDASLHPRFAPHRRRSKRMRDELLPYYEAGVDLHPPDAGEFSEKISEGRGPPAVGAE